MIENSKLTIFDGGDEIIFSNTFNVYSNEIKIWRIGWFELIFTFSRNWIESEQRIEIEPNTAKKEIRIKLLNFGTSLWTATTNKVSLMTLWVDTDKKEVFFSLFGSILNEATTFLQVTLTVYVR